MSFYTDKIEAPIVKAFKEATQTPKQKAILAGKVVLGTLATAAAIKIGLVTTLASLAGGFIINALRHDRLAGRWDSAENMVKHNQIKNIYLGLFVISLVGATTIGTIDKNKRGVVEENIAAELADKVAQTGKDATASQTGNVRLKDQWVTRPQILTGSAKVEGPDANGFFDVAFAGNVPNNIGGTTIKCLIDRTDPAKPKLVPVTLGRPLGAPEPTK